MGIKILQNSTDLQRLKQNQLVIWLINDHPDNRLFFSQYLQPNERTFINERRTARGALRYFLSRYQINEPLQKTVHGKLFTQNQIQFNVTHTFKKIGLIFAQNLEVGIDLEAHLPRQNWQKIAQRFKAKIDSLSEFYQFWTRKEAVTKSYGQSIFSPVAVQDRTTENLILQDHYSGAISYSGLKQQSFTVFEIL